MNGESIVSVHQSEIPVTTTTGSIYEHLTTFVLILFMKYLTQPYELSAVDNKEPDIKRGSASHLIARKWWSPGWKYAKPVLSQKLMFSLGTRLTENDQDILCLQRVTNLHFKFISCLFCCTVSFLKAGCISLARL